MKKLLKNTMIAILIALSLGFSPKKSYAGPVEAPAEMVGVLAMYVAKISKTALYIETIVESVTYVTSIGQQGLNAAVQGLMSMAGNLSAFQSVLHFSDAGQFGSLLGGINAVDSIKNIGNVGNIVEGVKGVANVGGALDVDLDYQAVGGMLGKTAANAVTQASGADGVTKLVVGVGAEMAGAAIGKAVEEAGEKGDENAQIEKSSYDKMGTVQKSYGQPQEKKEDAEKYIKSLYFYSVKEGDKYEGEELSETDVALEAVLENRNNYRKEVIAMSYGTAVENRTKVYEQSLERLEKIKQKANSAETADDKKAVEAMITQEETRQRMNRLSIDLAILERDVVDDLLEEPAEIIIARTPEQVEMDTQEKLEDVNYNKDEFSDFKDEFLETALGGQS